MGKLRSLNDNKVGNASAFATCGQKYALMLALVMVTTGTVGAGQNSTDAAIQSLQTHLKMYPQDFKAYDQLGASYIQKGREQRMRAITNSQNRPWAGHSI